MKIAVMSFAHGHAQSYIRQLQGRSGIEVRVSDPDHAARRGEEGGRTLADRLGVFYAESYDDLFAWRPDAVLVCSENAKHRVDVERAAAAGAHVLCEKPLATSLADATAMCAACEDAGVSLMIAHPVRFSPAVRAIATELAAGRWGPVRAVLGTNNGILPAGSAWFTDPRLSGGGAVTDHTVHVADILGMLLPGARPRTVYAQANSVIGDAPEAETAGLISLTYDDGTIVTIDCSWSKPPHYPVWGGLTLDVTTDKAVIHVDPFADRLTGFSESARNTVVLDYGADLDGALLDEFLAVARGERLPHPSGAEGLIPVAIVEAAYRSLAGGAVVPVFPEEETTLG